MAVSIARGIDAGSAAPRSLLVLLADGRLHSGEWLAHELGVSRAAVWKGVERLRMRGVEVTAVPRRGYALPQAVELLAEGPIRAAIADGRAPRLRSLDLQFDVDSTNTRLLATAPPPAGYADVMLSELQHAGRGRRGRHWAAPFGESIALSMGWSFTDVSRANPAVTLAVGVAVARALARAGARNVGLKWPNDVWLGDRKVGGVLTELRGNAEGPAHVVIGVGINVSLAPASRVQIEASGARVAAVADACEVPPSRNFVAGAIIDELLSMLVEFEEAGFAAYRTAWTGLDALRDRPAQVVMGENVVSGVARGVDAQGALRLEREGRIQEFVSGEVSLRGVGQI
ncbi:MAG: biotin--[acetyl-CoA-carboxylase] ligase [Pseudomonadota bacterium]|nr:biotin--[acetyl-CoA-carboxylase] ligase [Pseudomonadota bacterium]